MPNRPVVRANDHFNDHCDLWLAWDLFPVHPSGMALFFKNESPNPVRVTIQESANGWVWLPVLFSTPIAAGLANLDLVSRANAVVLFASRQQYVRVVVVPVNDGDDVLEGVYMWSAQYPPVGAATQGEGYT